MLRELVVEVVLTTDEWFNRTPEGEGDWLPKDTTGFSVSEYRFTFERPVEYNDKLSYDAMYAADQALKSAMEYMLAHYPQVAEKEKQEAPQDD